MLTKHPCFTAIPEIKNISDDYFGRLGLTLHHFGHSTVYPDGKFYSLQSTYEWAEYAFIEENMPVTGYRNYDYIKNEVTLPLMDTGAYLGLSDDEVRIVKERFGVENPMVIFRKQDDHVQVFSFELYDKRAYEIFITQFDIFENFIFYYKDKAQNLLKKVAENILTVPKKFRVHHQSTVMHQKNLLRPRKYYLRHDGVEVAVSIKEYECLSLLARGWQFKSIARKCNVSPRTVEKHLDRLKKKFNLSSREALAAIYWNNRFLSV